MRSRENLRNRQIGELRALSAVERELALTERQRVLISDLKAECLERYDTEERELTSKRNEPSSLEVFAAFSAAINVAMVGLMMYLF